MVTFCLAAVATADLHSLKVVVAPAAIGEARYTPAPHRRTPGRNGDPSPPHFTSEMSVKEVPKQRLRV